MIPALVNNPLFRGITPERLFADLEEISFHTRSYKKGEILAQQGAVCNRLVILTKGSVRGGHRCSKSDCPSVSVR